MSLVWHIVRKDVRRIALPVAVWVVLIVVPTWGFRFMSPAIEGHAASSLDGWARVTATWVRLLFAIQMLIGYVLAAALMLEDGWCGAEMFWKTRPVGRGRLLAAKLSGAALMFIGVPLLGLMAIWVASGFGWRELIGSAWAVAKVHGVMVLVALGLAAVSRSLGQALLFSIPAGMLTIAVAGVSVATLSGGMRSEMSGMEERSEDRAVEIVPDAAFTKFQANSVPTLFVSAPWTRDLGYVPMVARFSDGSLARGGDGPGAVESGLRVLGFSGKSEPLRWQVTLVGGQRGNGAELHVTGQLEVWAMRARILGEAPLKIEGTIVAGANRTRIVGFDRTGETLDAIFVEERDAAVTAAGAWSRNWSREMMENARYIDRYFLVTRATRAVRHVSASEVGGVDMNGLGLRYRRLFVSGADDWKDGMLVKLRFERERRFERSLEVRGVVAPRKGNAR